jgi:hypothetical protein
MSAGIPGQPDGPPSGYTGYGGRADHRNRPSRGSIRLARPRARLATTWPGSPGCHRLRRPMARRSDAATVTWQDHPGALWAGLRRLVGACAGPRGGLWAGLSASLWRYAACRQGLGGAPARLAGGCGRFVGGGLRAGVGGLPARLAGACRRGLWAVCRRGCGRLARGVCKGFAKGFGKAAGKPREGLPEDCRKTAGPRDRGRWCPLPGTDRDHLHAIECRSVEFRLPLSRTRPPGAYQRREPRP